MLHRRSEERVRKLKCESEKLRQDLLAASTALSAASATIADKQTKLTEVRLILAVDLATGLKCRVSQVKRAKKRLEREVCQFRQNHKSQMVEKGVGTPLHHLFSAIPQCALEHCRRKRPRSA